MSPLIWVGLLATVPLAHGSPLEPRIQLLALSGRPPAGSISAEHFTRFDAPPVINNAAQVAFLAGPASAGDHPTAGATSVWLTDGHEPRLIAAAPSLRPEAAEGPPLFDRFTHPVLNDAGDVLFEGTLRTAGGTGPQPQAIWWFDSGHVRMVARSQTAAPGFESRPFHSFFARPAFASDGSVAFFGKVGSTTDGNSLDGGLWVGDDRALALAAGTNGQTASPRPGEPGGRFDAQTFGSPFSDHPVVTQHGRTAFQGFVEGPLEHRFGLWTYDAADGLHLLVRSGDTAPGFDSRAFVSFLEPPRVNDRGDVTFVAFDGPAPQSQAGGVDVQLVDLALGVWSTRSGSLEAVVRQGDHPAGMDDSAAFVDFGNALMNGRSEVAVLAVIDVPSRGEQDVVGIWSDGVGAGGELRTVAQVGNPAPGTPEGILFHSFLEPALNNAGQVAFLAGLAGSDVSDAHGNVLGLWGQDRSGRLRLVARTGEAISVAEGEWRTIESLVFAAGSGGQDGRPRGLNDRGQVAFRARFTDGSSAIVLSNALTVPEPSAAALVVMIVLLLVLRKALGP